MSAKDKRNSMWHKSKKRPLPWWTKIVKEEKPYKKQENPAAKNAGYSKVLNVRVGKYSVGLTFDVKEAAEWRKAAAPFLNPSIEEVVYTLPGAA